MKTKLQAIKNFPGIYRVLVSQDGLQWSEPQRGGKFAVAIYRKDGGARKRVKRYFSSFEEAKKFRNDPRELPPATVSPLNTGRMTFRDLWSIYENTLLLHKSESTQCRYRSYLRHFQYFMDLYVDEIAPITIDNWIAWLKHPEYLKTQNPTRCDFAHEFSVLRTILNFYVSRIDRNYRMPFIKDHRDALKIRDKGYVRKDLTPPEFQRFIGSLGRLCLGTKWEPIYYMALMQYLTFTRIQEAAAFHFEDFNFDRNEVTVNKKIVFARTKGAETRLTSGSKANGGKIIFMQSLLGQIFREWTLKTGIRGGPLFQINGGWITYRQIENKYTQALSNSGLPYSGTHILRHAALTEAQEISGDLNQTKFLAGHSSIKTTEKYAKVRPHQVRETQSKLDEKFEQLWGNGSQRFAFQEK